MHPKKIKEIETIFKNNKNNQDYWDAKQKKTKRGLNIISPPTNCNNIFFPPGCIFKNDVISYTSLLIITHASSSLL